MRGVIDTNVIVSGLFWRGAPADIFREATAGKFSLLVTAAILAELERVLDYPKLAVYLNRLNKTGSELTAAIRQIAEVVTPADIPSDVIRDVNDVIILACAVGGQADYIVSGDKDLLVLNSFRDIPIVDAAQFLQYLNNAQDE